MGTKGSYTGAGGSDGDGVRDGVDDWLASLPGSNNSVSAADGAVAMPQAGRPSGRPSPSSAAGRLLPVIGTFRSSRGGGSGSGSTARRAGTTGLTRSTGIAARSAGRGAAAAYAYRTGNAQALRDLGLDYDALRANPNIFDVAHQIAQQVCADLPEGTIDTAEQLQVVGTLAEWLLESDGAGQDVTLGQIAEEAVALILAEAYLVETASTLNAKELSGAERAAFEDGVREAAEELAAHANLTPSGPTPEEFTAAIEDGLDYLRRINEEP